MRKTQERALPSLDADSSSSAATPGEPLSSAATQHSFLNSETNTTLSLVPKLSTHRGRHHKRRKIQNETTASTTAVQQGPPFVPDCEIVGSILVAGIGRQEQDQQGNIFERRKFMIFVLDTDQVLRFLLLHLWCLLDDVFRRRTTILLACGLPLLKTIGCIQTYACLFRLFEL